MAKTVRETIKDIVYRHLTVEKSLCFGQCLTAVGWVGGTLPKLYEDDGMVELTTADVANGGFVVGAGLKGIRPIYVVRYQGFQWFNSPIIINYATKSKEIWGVPCPIFIRSIAMEGGMGPVAGSSHHSIYYRMPGIKIISPMTPKEYEYAYKKFLLDDDVYYVSEHRGSYDNSSELTDIAIDNCDIVLFPISITRFEAEKARAILLEKDIKASIFHQLWIKPFDIKDKWISSLKSSRYGGLVLDDDYDDGVAKSIAHKIMMKCDRKVYTLGLDDRTAGFHESVDNLPPTAEKIVHEVERIISLA
jgi:pyruvate/2-oxoglutarate/acetoin dehydrogenase E1 component